MTRVGLILLLAALYRLHQAHACVNCIKDLHCYVGTPTLDDFKVKRGFEDWKHESCVGLDLCLRLIRHSQPNLVELQCANMSSATDVPPLGCQIVDNGVEEIQRCFCNTAYCNKDEQWLPDQSADGPKWDSPVDSEEWGHGKPKTDTVLCNVGEQDLGEYATGQSRDQWPTEKCSSDRCMRVIRREKPDRVEMSCGRVDAGLQGHPLGCQMVEDGAGEIQRCYCKKDKCNSSPTVLPGTSHDLQWSTWSGGKVLHCYVCDNKDVADCGVEQCAAGVTGCVQNVAPGVTSKMCGEAGKEYKQGCVKQGEKTQCFCETELCNDGDGDLRADDQLDEAPGSTTKAASRGVNLTRDSSVLFVALIQVVGRCLR